MELRFVSPELRRLDELDLEVLVCTIWSDARPVHGVAGLCDWRLGGRISRLLRDGFLTGQPGEVMLLPGRPRLSFEKIVIAGLGPRESFDESRFHDALGVLFKTMDGLVTRAGAVELPGRQDELITAERAADLLLEAAGRQRDRHVWTLVENADARQRINQHMIEERRRVRRAP